MKKNLLCLSLMSFCVMGLVGCNSNTTSSTPGTSVPATSTDEVTPVAKSVIQISGPAEHQAFVTERFAEAKKGNSDLAKALAGYTLNYLTIGEDKVDSTVVDWNNGPDIYAYASDKISELYKQGAIGEVPTTYATAMSNDMGAGAIDAATYAGKRLAYPYAGDNGYFLYYNKKVLNAEQISSFENLFAAAKENKMKIGYPLNTAFYSMGALFTYGARYGMEVNASGVVTQITANFNTEAGIKAAKAIKWVMTQPEYQEQQGAPVADKEGAIIATIDGSWNASAYATALGEDYACAKMPTITVDGDTKTMSSFLGYKLYGVNPIRSGDDANRLSVVHGLANYLVSKESQEARFKALATAPTNKEVAATDEVVATPHIAALAAQAEFAVAQGAVPANVWSAPVTYTQSIIDGQVTDENVAQFMENLNKSIIDSK